MNSTQWLQTRYLPIPLIALMVLTRFHHFGDALHLPDASLAVFFIAGFYRKTLLFVFLLILAGLIDYVAIANGTSAYCISPAYVFLLPTYGVMWSAGRYCSKFELKTGSEWALCLGLLSLATTAAFIVSNGSFYLFSGRHDALEWGRYIAQTAGYFLPYAGAALGYSVVIYAAAMLLGPRSGMQAEHKEL
ncbi:MAG: hypothetical protein ACU841_04755 [Gammaproteobacteria bacterium]